VTGPSEIARPVIDSRFPSAGAQSSRWSTQAHKHRRPETARPDGILAARSGWRSSEYKGRDRPPFKVDNEYRPRNTARPRPDSARTAPPYTAFTHRGNCTSGPLLGMFLRGLLGFCKLSLSCTPRSASSPATHWRDTHAAGYEWGSPRCKGTALSRQIAGHVRTDHSAGGVQVLEEPCKPLARA
jgi:hypothetical protein